MLFVSIASFDLVSKVPSDADGIELRLDLFSHIELEAIQSLLRDAKLPLLLTVRSQAHGGKFQGIELEREAWILQLLELKPQFLDLEWDMRGEFLAFVFEHYPGTQIVLSCHGVEISELETVYQTMSCYPAFTYKIALMVSSTLEALDLLLFAKKHPNTSVIAMGQRGSFARVLGPLVGNKIDFASLDESSITAPGQLSFRELVDTYRYRFLNRETAVYGLIGDPVSMSVGHVYHNEMFKRHGVNAVYVKMSVLPNELEAFFSLIKELSIQGLSVTMPLKEAVLPFVCNTSPIGSVNTLWLQEGEYLGTNTDGPAAVQLLERRGSLVDKTVVVLGAGGAARAIVFMLQARGARVVVLNRTLEKAKELSSLAGTLDEVPPEYHAIIQCTPLSMPIDPRHLLPKAIAMDMVYVPRETEFLVAAKKAGCDLIYGEEFFAAQAALQSALWLSNELPSIPAPQLL
jgi:3-dehydroquinate dehydratase/shikimate dehydrogenase